MTLDNGATSPAGDITPATPATPDNQDWRSSLPESVQAWEETKTSADADSFFSQMGEMRSMIGRSLQVPSEDAGTEARNKYLQQVLAKTPEVIVKPNGENMDDFYNSMGRPEAPDKYTLPEVEGVEFDPNLANAFAPIAHETGLSNKQYQAAIAKMQQAQQQSMEATMAEKNEGIQALKGEWGMAFEQHMNAAQNYVSKVLPSIGDVSQLPASSIKELFEASKTIGSEGTPLTQESGAELAMTPAEATERVSEIMTNPDHPANNPGHPGYKAATQKLLDLADYAAGRDPQSRGKPSKY